MTTDTPTSSALDAALADLPAKPRVHELAKRSGLSSKELIAALAERGTVVKAASSSVDRAAAVAVLTVLLGAGATPEATGSPADVPAEPRASTPAAAPSVPLFLEPDAVVTPPRTRSRRKPAAETTEPVADAQPTPDEPADGADTPAPRSRRRRKPASDERTSAPDADPTSGGPPAAAPDAGDQQDQDDTDRDDADGTDGTDGTDGDSADDDRDSGRRRRRRGRRGRGRVSDGDDQGSDGDEQKDGDGQDGTPEDGDRQDGDGQQGDGRQGSGRSRGRGRSRGGAASRGANATQDSESSRDGDGDAEGEEQDDSDENQDGDGEGGAGSRRRRRRRRGGSGDAGENGRDDDPDNTVVHVREARTAESAASEVQGIRGSTRLEAKRQRRRDSRDSRRRPQILTEAEFLARRESVDRVMAVRQRGDLAQVALLEDNILVEHFVSRAGSASMIGNIYLGKVQNVLPSMEAAFVDIGRGRNAVLYAGEVNWDSAGLQGKGRRIEAALSSGDTVLVQVSKDPIGHKGARLTTQISLPGRFLVYVPAGGATGISRKLPDTERKRLKGILDRIVPDDAGVIIRTAAEGVSEEELARDVERLKSQWETIKAAGEVGEKSGKNLGSPEQLSAEPDTLIKVVRDLFNSDINMLVVDGDEAWESVSTYVEQVAPELAARVQRYEGAGDVFSGYRIDEQIAKALERKVHLPSGGSLVIDRTEAMTVVDVNTGKYTGSGGNLEETVTKNNLEAAEEVVRQLRLRDIGGIIVVDFIDMVLESNRDLVLRRLTECLGRDRTRHQVAEVTSLGLIQMTRKRMGTGLVEAFSAPCEHCQGRGVVLKDVPVDHTPQSDSESGDGGRAPAGKKRRERKRGADDSVGAVVESVTRIVNAKADPRGPRMPKSGMEDGVDASTTTADVTQVVEEVVEALTAAATGATSSSAAAAAPVSPEVDDRWAEPEAAPEPPARRSRGRRRATSKPADLVAEPVVLTVEAPSEKVTSEKATPEKATSGNVTSEKVTSRKVAPVPEQVSAAEPIPVPEPASENSVGSTTDAPARPRRRRAASRPAGPAGTAEPVSVNTGGGDGG